METKSPLSSTDNATTSSSSISTATASAVLPPADHNDIVERAAFVVWLGIFTLLAVFLLLIALLLFFPLSGLNFVLAIIEMSLGFVIGVFAIFWATMSPLSIAIFRIVAIVFALAMLAIAIIEFINFVIFLTTDTTNPVTTVLIDVLRATFLFVMSLVFLGLMIAFYVMATHYAHALERKTLIESDTTPMTENDEETTLGSYEPRPPPYVSPSTSGVRHRAGGFGVTLVK